MERSGKSLPYTNLQTNISEMRKYFLATALVACFSCANAQTFDMTVPQPSYSDATGYGWDVVEAPTAKELKAGLSRPVFFSVKVPDGNYKVTVILCPVFQGGSLSGYGSL